MKLFGYWFEESPSGNHHIISHTEREADAIAVPQDRMTEFRKLPYKERGKPEHPRRCIFQVEGWLGAKPDYQKFREAKFGTDYV